MSSWQVNPNYAQCEELVTDDGQHIARLEDFGGYCCYPSAFNPLTKRWERGGPQTDRIEAKLWAERVAGEHPVKPGDERPPFYY